MFTLVMWAFRKKEGIPSAAAAGIRLYFAPDTILIPPAWMKTENVFTAAKRWQYAAEPSPGEKEAHKQVIL